VSLRSLDKTGTGFLKRPDILRFITGIGYSAVGPQSMQHMLELFETKVSGQVNYGNMCQYIRENPATAAFEKLSADFLEFLLSKDRSLGDATLRHFFKLIDKNSGGKFGPKQLAAFISESRISTSREAVLALFGAIVDASQSPGSRNDGVGYSTFSSWARLGASRLGGTKTHDSDMAQVFGSVSLMEIKRKAQTYLTMLTYS
jgi:Ca2+-binding EF-hand superfamily protein